MNENFDKGLSPGKDSRAQQPGPGRHQATAENRRMKWTKEVNKIVMKCYIKSDPSKRGYRKRMMEFWKVEGICDVTEQRLADQARQIKTNQWLSAIYRDRGV